MPQFTPSSRERVLGEVLGKDQVYDAAPLGEGVVAYDSECTEKTFTNLSEKYGWYVASYDARDTGRDRIVFMPFTGGDG